MTYDFRPQNKGTTMIVVTGAAGFIGSCLLAKLNERGIKDIIIVDHLEDGAKNYR